MDYVAVKSHSITQGASSTHADWTCEVEFVVSSGNVYPTSEVEIQDGYTFSTLVSDNPGSIPNAGLVKSYSGTIPYGRTVYVKGLMERLGGMSTMITHQIAGGSGWSFGPLAYVAPDTTPPSVSFSYSGGTDSGYGYWDTSSTSTTITANLSDASGVQSFDWRISEFTLAIAGTTPTLTKVPGSWASASGSSKQITVDANKIICLEIRNAKDTLGNTNTGTQTSRAYMVTQSVPVTSATVNTVALPTAGCNDFWEHGPPNYPQSGLVDIEELKTSTKFKNWIASQYGMSAADVEWTLNWVEWVTSADRKGSALHAGISGTESAVDPPSLPDHGGLGRVQGWYGQCLPNGVVIYSSNHSGKNAYTVTGGSGLNGRSGGWYNGLYGRGHNGSSQLTACWVGTRSAGQWFPQPVAEHLAYMGASWGLTQHAGYSSTFWGIRGSGTDGGGNQNNQHRQRDDFMLWAIHSWNPGSKVPRNSPHPGQSVGIDKWLASAGLIAQGGGMYKISDCIPPTIDELRVKSTTVMAGNGKEYYTDYPNTGHICHFEVEATDLEYGLKHAIFTPYIDTSGGGTFTAGSPSAPFVFAGNPRGPAVAGPFTIDTQGHKEVYCDVEVFDMADNSSTETMSAKVISIDDAEPSGGGGWSGSGGTTLGTNNIQTAGIRLENIPYMVGTKPYWNEKKVDFFIEYGDEYSGIAEAKLYINGTHESSVTLPQTSTAILHAQIHTVTNGNLREGKNNCQLWLKDLATNEWWSQSLEFYIDMTDPDGYLEFSTQFQLRENNGKLWTKENDIDVDLFYGDPGPDASGVNSGATGVGSIPSSHNVGLSGNQLLNHNQGGLSVGQNDIYFTVKDYVSWEEDGAGSGPMTTDKITLYVDQTPPTGSIARNSGQLVNTVDSIEYANTTNFNVDLQHDDADSGLF
ncbi:MAG: hypothetical protein VW270_00305 [Candidatus Poseidoniales archaeon]